MHVSYEKPLVRLSFDFSKIIPKMPLICELISIKRKVMAMRIFFKLVIVWNNISDFAGSMELPLRQFGNDKEVPRGKEMAT